MKKFTKIKELKKQILLAKKAKNKQVIGEKEVDIMYDSKAYAAILKQVEKKTIGVKNVVGTEEEIILKAFKSELSEQLESKKLGSKYDKSIIELCEIYIETFGPKTKTKSETEALIDVSFAKLVTVDGVEEKDINFKVLINEIKSTNDIKLLDMKLVSSLINLKLASL